MARGINKLTALAVAKQRKAGRYSDGGGLYLQVGPTGGKSWLFRFMHVGRAREMGLGPVDVVSLAEARSLAGDARKLLHEGIDPLDRRNEKEARAKAERLLGITFKECATAYIASHRAGWRNEKHASQWENTLATYAYPFIGTLPVHAIETGHMMKCLEPIWRDKTETATRLRGRIERILDWATARGYRRGDNPARWRGHLDTLLPAKAKVQRVQHHSALPYTEIGSFMESLRGREGVSARALEFTILTAVRTGEALNAKWSEFDIAKGEWVIPAVRMKAGKEHRVPLSAPAINILRELHGHHLVYVFPGQREGQPLSNMSLLKVLERMGRADLTTHGFRSTFRDWCAECTNFPREVAEMALAHVIGDKVEAAYRRGDLFLKRRKLMEAWASHCAKTSQSAEVLPLRA